MAPWVEGHDWVGAGGGYAGDDLTEQRLDEQQGNADFVREEGRWSVALQSNALIVQDVSGFDQAHWGRLRVVVGGNTYSTAWTQNPIPQFPDGYPFRWQVALPENQVLSGLSLGTIYHVDLYIDLDTAIGQGSVTAYQVGRGTFFYREDMGFLSVLADVRWIDDETAAIDGITVLVTRDEEGL